MSEAPEFSDDPSSSSSRGASPPGSSEPDSEAEGPTAPADGPEAFGRDPFADADANPFSGGEAGGGPSRNDQVRMAWDLTRMWVKEHQTAAMLGAFAAGVFVGAYVRD